MSNYLFVCMCEKIHIYRERDDGDKLQGNCIVIFANLYVFLVYLVLFLFFNSIIYVYMYLFTISYFCTGCDEKKMQANKNIFKFL